MSSLEFELKDPVLSQTRLSFQVSLENFPFCSVFLVIPTFTFNSCLFNVGLSSFIFRCLVAQPQPGARMEVTGVVLKDQVAELVLATQRQQSKVKEMETCLNAIKELAEKRVKMREERLEKMKEVEQKISENKKKMHRG